MIPSLHSLISPVVYPKPKVPYLAHSFSLYTIYFLLARWSKKIPSNTICTLMTPAVHLFHSYKFYSISWNTSPILSLTFFPGWTWTNCSLIHLKLNFFLLAQNSSVSNFLILQIYLSAMISIPVSSSICSQSWLHLWLWHVFLWSYQLSVQILSFSHPRHSSNSSSSSEVLPLSAATALANSLVSS